MSGTSNVPWNPHSDMCSPLMSSSGTQWHITSLFFQRWRTETEWSAEARRGENNKQHFTPHHLFPSFLSSCFPQAHLHSSPHLFFPFCCQATDRKNITWRRQNHRKSLQEDAASHRCSMEELGSMRTLKNPQFLLCSQHLKLLARAAG